MAWIDRWDYIEYADGSTTSSSSYCEIACKVHVSVRVVGGCNILRHISLWTFTFPVSFHHSCSVQNWYETRVDSSAARWRNVGACWMDVQRLILKGHIHDEEWNSFKCYKTVPSTFAYHKNSNSSRSNNKDNIETEHMNEIRRQSYFNGIFKIVVSCKCSG